MTTEPATEITTDDVWIVLGNANNWGKADCFKDALGNSIKEAGQSHPMTEMVVYKFLDVPLDQVKTGVYVDEMGTVHYPKGITMLKLRCDCPIGLVNAYFAFDDKADEFEWSPAMTAVFEK